MAGILKKLQQSGFPFIFFSFILILILFRLHVPTGIFSLILVVWLLTWLWRYRGNLAGMMGYLHYLRGNTARAERLCHAALEMGCSMPVIALAYGMMQLRKGRFTEAQELFEGLVQKNGKGSVTHAAQNNLVLVYWKKGQLDQAIATAEQLLPVFQNTGLYVNLVYLYFLRGDLEKAEALNREALSFNPSSAGILDNAGLLYNARGDMERAEAAFRKALEINPSSADSHYNLGVLLHSVNRHEEALDELKKSLHCDISLLSSITREQVEREIERVEQEMKRDEQGIEQVEQEIPKNRVASERNQEQTMRQRLQ